MTDLGAFMKAVKAFSSLIFIVAAAVSASAQFSQKSHVEGELLVKFKDGTASASASRANNVIGARVLEKFSDLKWQRVKLPAGLAVEAAMGNSRRRIRPTEFLLSSSRHAERPAISERGNVGTDENFRPRGLGLDDGQRRHRRRRNRYGHQL